MPREVAAIRRRAQHLDSYRPELWLSIKGPVSDSSVRRRGVVARLGRLYLHQLRHTIAHDWMAEDCHETGLDVSYWLAFKDHFSPGRPERHQKKGHRRPLPH